MTKLYKGNIVFHEGKVGSWEYVGDGIYVFEPWDRKLHWTEIAWSIMMVSVCGTVIVFAMIAG